MKMTKLLILFLTIGVIGSLLSNANAQTELSPKDYADVMGIHSWLVKIPSDLSDDEYLTTFWSSSSKDTRKKFPGIDFKGVMPGSTAKLFIWIGILPELYRSNRVGMKFNLKFTDMNGEIQKRKGMLKIPFGFTEIYGYQPSGGDAHRGSLILMRDPNRHPDQAVISLEFRKTKLESDLPVSESKKLNAANKAE